MPNRETCEGFSLKRGGERGVALTSLSPIHAFRAQLWWKLRADQRPDVCL